MLTVILVALALHIGFAAGYYVKYVQLRLRELLEAVQSKRDKPVEVKSSKIIDPLDPVYQAKQEFIRKQKAINPEYEFIEE